MKESYGEGVATHTGLESCAGARKGMGEALTEACAGRVLSCESFGQFGVPTQSIRVEGNSEICCGPRAVGDPVHAQKLLAQELGDPVSGLNSWRGGPRRES
jgi:hypothetical protein